MPSLGSEATPWVHLQRSHVHEHRGSLLSGEQAAAPALPPLGAPLRQQRARLRQHLLHVRHRLRKVLWGACDGQVLQDVRMPLQPGTTLQGPTSGIVYRRKSSYP